MILHKIFLIIVIIASFANGISSTKDYIVGCRNKKNIQTSQDIFSDIFDEIYSLQIKNALNGILVSLALLSIMLIHINM